MFIKDLTVVISCAGIFGLLFHVLKIPVVLSYLVSGIILGTQFMSPFISEEGKVLVKETGELGVLFLMFYIGLEFDLRKLKQTLFPSLLATLIQLVTMVFLSTLITPLLGWSTTNRLFLGGILALSSTMISLSILQEQNAMQKSYAQFTISILILEDIIAILLLVILTSIGISGKCSTSALVQILFFLGIFIATVFFFGRLLMPKVLRFFEKVEKTDILTIVFVGIILIAGIVSSSFSMALGAFLAGTIFSQTHFAHKIQNSIEPIKNISSAIFFISIGMSIHLEALWLCSSIIIPLIILTVIAKLFSCHVGLILGGQKSSTAFYASIPKVQLGEFSFIIAALGQSLGVTHPNLIVVTAGVALGSSLLTPFLTNKTEFLFNFLGKRTPVFLKQFCQFYQSFLAQAQQKFTKSTFHRLIKGPLNQILLRFLLINGILWSGTYVANFADKFYSSFFVQIGIWTIAIILSSPLLMNIVKNLNIILTLIHEKTFKNFQNHTHLKTFSQIYQISTIILTTVLFSVIFFLASSSFLPSYMPLAIFLVLSVGFGLIFWKNICNLNLKLESVFLGSFQMAIESEQEKRQKLLLKKLSTKYPWELSIQSILLSSESSWAGKTIQEINLRNRTGSTIVGITRNKFTWHNPTPDAYLFPGDIIIVLGETKHLKLAEQMAEESDESNENNSKQNTKHSSIDLEQVLIGPFSQLANETISSANVRKRFNVNIIGIQRGKTKLSSLNSTEIIQAGDILFVIGDEKSIKSFKEQNVV